MITTIFAKICMYYWCLRQQSRCLQNSKPTFEFSRSKIKINLRRNQGWNVFGPKALTGSKCLSSKKVFRQIFLWKCQNRIKSLDNKSVNTKKAHTDNCILLTLSNWLSSGFQHWFCGRSLGCQRSATQPRSGSLLETEPRGNWHPIPLYG